MNPKPKRRKYRTAKVLKKNAGNRDWYQRNKEEILKRQREYRAKVQARDPEKLKRMYHQRYVKNREYYLKYSLKYQRKIAKKRKALGLNSKGTGPRMTGWERRRFNQKLAREKFAAWRNNPQANSKKTKEYWATLTPEQRRERMRKPQEARRLRREARRRAKELFGPNYRDILS